MGFTTSTLITRSLLVSDTHQRIDDHALLHRDSLHKELSGPILRLIAEDVQVFIVVPSDRQQFRFLITGLGLRRHQGWEEEGCNLRTRPGMTYNLITWLASQMRAQRSGERQCPSPPQVRALGPRSLDSRSRRSLISACLCHTARDLSRICLASIISSPSLCQKKANISRKSVKF